MYVVTVELKMLAAGVHHCKFTSFRAGGAFPQSAKDTRSIDFWLSDENYRYNYIYI